MGYKEWVEKQKGNPVHLIGAIVGFTFTGYLINKYVIAPYRERQRLRVAETYANILLQERPVDK